MVEEGLFFDGDKPLAARVDIATADFLLARALENVRARIDLTFGPQLWENVSQTRYVSGDYATCTFPSGEGRYTSRDEGMAFGLADEDFPRILEIVKEEVEPIGYDHMIDSSGSAWFYVDFYNRADGGVVHVTKARGSGLIFQVNTGCRPWDD